MYRLFSSEILYINIHDEYIHILIFIYPISFTEQKKFAPISKCDLISKIQKSLIHNGGLNPHRKF